MKAARVREWSASQRPATPGLSSAAARVASRNCGVSAPGTARLHVWRAALSGRATEYSDPRGWLAQQEQQIAVS